MSQRSKISRIAPLDCSLMEVHRPFSAFSYDFPVCVKHPNCHIRHALLYQQQDSVPRSTGTVAIIFTTYGFVSTASGALVVGGVRDTSHPSIPSPGDSFECSME